MPPPPRRAPVFTRAAIRALDARAISEFHLPGVALMENAGRAVAAHARAMLDPRGRVVIACGPGNNGGDGFVAARHLDAAGVPVRLLLAADPDRLAGDAALNFAVVRAMRLPVTRPPASRAAGTARRLLAALSAGDVVIDALLGTGLSRPVPAESPLAILIHALNARRDAPRPPRVLAVDLPSGLDADSGLPLIESPGGAPRVAVRAHRTVTFVGLKPGLLARGAGRWTGAVRVESIGAPRTLVAALARSGSAHAGGLRSPRDAASAAEVD